MAGRRGSLSDRARGLASYLPFGGEPDDRKPVSHRANPPEARPPARPALRGADDILAAGGSPSARGAPPDAYGGERAAPAPPQPHERFSQMGVHEQAQRQAEGRGPAACDATVAAQYHGAQPADGAQRYSQMGLHEQAQGQATQAAQQVEYMMARYETGDDLGDKLAAWKEAAAGTFEGLAPCGALKVTVMAARGMSAAEPCWVATCAGQSVSSGAASSYHIVPSGAGGGGVGGSAPSWSSEPLSLPVYDVTADLALFLCDASPEGRRAVGRVVVPLTQLLPLNPLRAPRPLQGWVAIFPLGAQGEGESASLKYAEAVPGAPGLAMAPPPQGLGACLIKLELALHRPLLACYLLQPPFEPGAASRAADAHTGYDALPPEQLTHALLRLTAAASAPPALLVYSAAQQPLCGVALLLPLGWLLYGMSAAALPWWLLLVWLANGAARRRVHATRSLNPWEPPPPGGYRAAAEASAADKLALLHAVARPLVGAAAGAASAAERLYDAPSAADPLAFALSLLPALLAAAAASLLLGLAAALVYLLGGAANVAMGAAAAAAGINLARFYQREILAWAGAGADPAAKAGAADTAKLLPPGAADSAAEPPPADGPMSPEKAVLGLIEGGKRLGAAWEESTSKAAEIASKPTAQKLLRATSAVATNLWRRLPDRLEATHRAIARAAIRPEEVGATPAAAGKADEYSA